MIDIGVNLCSSQFRDKHEELLSSAKSVGVEQIVVTGTDIQSSLDAVKLCQQYQAVEFSKLFSTAGIHPHHASEWSDETDQQIRQLLELPQVVAVGETGLDFNRNFSTPDEQILSFTKHLEIACDTGTSLFLHERDAFERQFETLSSFSSELPPVVIHCFTGSRDSLLRYLDRGFYIGITGWVCDERRGLELAKIVSEIPLDRLMIETDAPYLLPRNIVPKPESRVNEPANLVWVVRKLAECYGVDESEIVSESTQNAKRFLA